MEYRTASRPTPWRVVVRHRGLRDGARIGIAVVLGVSAACQTNDARAPADTALRADSMGVATQPASATPPTTRDTSAGTVAVSPAAPTDTAAPLRRDTTSAPRHATVSANAPQRDTSGRRAATRANDSVAPRANRTAPAATASSTSVAPKSDSATRDTATSSERPSKPAAAAQAQPGQGGDKLAVTQSEYNGWKTFAVNCTRCHGEDAVGSTIAPNLMKSLREHVTHEVFEQTVKHGRPEKGMPAWEALLSDAQVEDLYAYLKARSENRLAPGRPHVKAGN